MGRREMQRPFYLQAHHGRTKTTKGFLTETLAFSVLEKTFFPIVVVRENFKVCTSSSSGNPIQDCLCNLPCRYRWCVLLGIR